jgi:hypothetical protein
LKVDGNTKYRRYAPDSVRFADAKKSDLAEIVVGAQVRARGQKGEDGSLAAEEIVFGNFSTRAGTITSVDEAAQEVSVKEAGAGKPLLIRVSADSQLKRMLDRQAMIQMMHGSQKTGGEHAQAPPMMTLAEMLERLPAVKVSDLKTGDIVIVSSTRGAKPDEVTAISMLANAEMLLQIAAMQSGAGQNGPGTVTASASLEMLSSMGFGVVQ